MENIGIYSHKIGTLIIAFSDSKIIGVSKGNRTDYPEVPSWIKNLFQNMQDNIEIFKNLDISHMSDFQKKILMQVSKIAKGETRTYKDIANEVSTEGVRAVGHAIATNPFPILIPCHRVVRADGIGQYIWGSEIKAELLNLEKL